MYLVAPDSFKGTFTAGEVAAAMASGLSRAGGDADVCPLADGGEGTMEVLAGSLGGRLATAPARDPLGRRIEARFGLLADRSAVVEVAQASGLGLVAEAEREPEAATSAGTGDLIVAAARAGADRILVAAGGSATTDGGAGALDAIAEAGGIGRARLTVLCDVRTPFEAAAATFGPQKGADAAAVARLEARLARLAESFDRDPRGVPMTGCAGGLGGGLWAQLGAELVSGAEAVLDATRFDARAAAATLVVTGEGRLDEQSLQGKLVGEVAHRCLATGVPLAVIAGAVSLEGAARALPAEHVAQASSLDEIEAAARSLVPEGVSGPGPRAPLD